MCAHANTGHWKWRLVCSEPIAPNVLNPVGDIHFILLMIFSFKEDVEQQIGTSISRRAIILDLGNISNLLISNLSTLQTPRPVLRPTFPCLYVAVAVRFRTLASTLGFREGALRPLRRGRGWYLWGTRVVTTSAVPLWSVTNGYSPLDTACKCKRPMITYRRYRHIAASNKSTVRLR